MKHTFKAHLNQLEAIQNFILILANPLSKEIRKDILLAVEEVVVNIIHYGNLKEKECIEVECELFPQTNELIVQFKDEGIPFNPLEYLDAPIEKGVGGLGIRLYNKLMDKVTYSQILGFNHLTLVKYV